ncbi:MAG: DUF4421 family protein [Chitinophagaceae bacterium]
MTLLLLTTTCCVGQQKVDTGYVANFKLPYSIRFTLEKTGAGLEISPDNTLSAPTASFPFNSGINAGINVSYKFLNFSISKSLESSTKNSSLVFATKFYSGANVFGGKIGFYKNVASLNDSKNLDLKSSIRLFKFSPYWMINTNIKRYSFAAVTDYSQIQKKSAGAFIFEINPSLVIANGNNEDIIPDNIYYRSIFENMAGLSKVTILNVDFRPGYAYTKVFEEGEYFIGGGIFLGPGFGYHSLNAIDKSAGLHWQSSLRLSATAGLHREKYFLVAGFRYTNSFTPVKTIGILSDEGSFAFTFGLRLGELEKAIPKTFGEIIHR